jgi:hypothetical protein
MTTYYLNGTPIAKDSDIILNGMIYPYSWLEGTSPSVRASLGIEKDGDINFDTKYYWGIDNAKILEDTEEVDKDGNPLYVKVFDATVGERGEMVDSDKRLVTPGLKTTCTSEVKNTTNNLLSSTDYYILRNEVEEVEIPAAISTYRTAVVAEQERVVTAIAAVDTVEELIEVMNSIAWPKAE